jgi:hypothetical protein
MRLPEPILITSIPRSGSSMIAGILSLCGIDAGQTINPDKSYTTHLQENQRIRGLISYAFKENLVDPQAQFPLPTRHFLLPEGFRRRCFSTMVKEGVKGLWYYKDNRLPLIWEEINKEFPEAKWILVYRSENGILESCKKTGFMQAFSKTYILQQIDKETAIEGWKWWLGQYQERVLEMQYALNIRFVYPEKMMHGNFTEIKSIIEWVGGTWDEQAVKQFIEPKLRRK